MKPAPTPQPLAPVAFLGPDATEQVQPFYRLPARFLPVSVPRPDLSAAIGGLAALGFLGAILSGETQAQAPALVGRASLAATQAGAMDALAVHGSTLMGDFTFSDALTAALEDAGARLSGARVLVLGSGATARAAVALSRLGLAALTVCGPDRPSAERVLALAPGSLERRAVTFTETGLADAVRRADLLVLAERGARLDARLLEPAHALVEAAGPSLLSTHLRGLGGQVIAHERLTRIHLAAQVKAVTAQAFDPGDL
ncbi:MAG TPA: hypothetical protein VHN99_04025 [Deinococcales bacterium]|nr:hypothetical protein [Deinococcales bacterium]